MCGIAGIHRRGDAPVPKMRKLARELLLGIEGRGPDSTGYLAMLDSGKVQTEKAPVRASTFVRSWTAFDEDARSVLLHTRLPTVGAVNALNAQPQIAGRCAATHNGTIRNATELFKTFGLKRRAQVDSEIIPALIDHAGWENADAALELLEGGAAVAVVNADHPREVLLARTQHYPLVWLATDEFVVWASTEKAIVDAFQFAWGTPPPAGQWGTLGQWSMLRVNGDIELGRLSPVAPAPKPRPRVKTSAKGKRRKARKVAATKKAAGRAVRAREATRRVIPTPDYPDMELSVTTPWGDDEVRSVMRWTGMSYAEAFDTLLGPDRSDETEWQTALWA